MIETLKLLSRKYDTNVVPHLKTSGIEATRGNDLRIFKTRFKYDLRKSDLQKSYMGLSKNP